MVRRMLMIPKVTKITLAPFVSNYLDFQFPKFKKIHITEALKIIESVACQSNETIKKHVS